MAGLRNIIKLIVKYRLYYPYTFYRLFYYNFFSFNRRKHVMFIPSQYAILDISKTALVSVNQPILFGFCNMKRSRLETGLVVGNHAKVELGAICQE